MRFVLGSHINYKYGQSSSYKPYAILSFSPLELDFGFEFGPFQILRLVSKSTVYPDFISGHYFPLFSY